MTAAETRAHGPISPAGTTAPRAIHPLTPGLTDPYRLTAALRRVAPAHRDPATGMWLIVDHALATCALRDPAFSAAGGQQQRAREDDLPVSMLTTDGDLHRRLRGPATAAYSARAVQRLRPAIDRLATARLSAALNSDADGLEDLGYPLAADVLGLFLGLPTADWPALQLLARPASANLDPLVHGAAAAAAAESSRALTRFLAEMSDEARHAGRELAGIPAGADLTDSERLGILTLTVVGGFEPLAVLIGTTLALVLGSAELTGLLVEHPEHAGAMVDEALRLESPIPFTARLCHSGYRDSRADLPPGAMVLVMLGAANRDPSVFDQPDEFDLHRDGGRHLALGGGAHYCLGAGLVRLTVTAVLHAIARRRPLPRLAPGWRPRWRPTVIPRALVDLPLLP